MSAKFNEPNHNLFFLDPPHPHNLYINIFLVGSSVTREGKKEVSSVLQIINKYRIGMRYVTSLPT